MSDPENKQGNEKKKFVDTSQKYKDFKWKDPDAFKNGPIGDGSRKCRDILCLIIFLVFLGGCVVVAFFGFRDGNPDLILYPYDEDSHQCGKGDLANYPLLYFYDTLNNIKVFDIKTYVNSFCVSKCPSESYTDPFPTKVNVACYPTKNNSDCSVEYKNYYKSKSMLSRFCIPSATEPVYIEKDGELYIKKDDIDNNANDLFNKAFFSADKLITWLGDLFNTWEVLLASLGWSLIIALLFLFFVRFCAGFIIYFSIFLILGALIALGLFFHFKADEYDLVNDSTYHTTMVALAWTCWVLSMIWFLFILFMCNRIRLAVGIMSATAKYIGKNCCIIFVPVLFFLFTGVFYAYWVFLSVYIYSTGELGESSIIASIKWSNQTRYSWWFHLFALLYMNEMINAIAQFVYASSACIWYFTHEKGGDDSPIKTSFKRVFRYHFGSLAFGALIVAIIKFIMVMMNYVKKKIDKTLGRNSRTGKIYKCLVCCCQCCMTCIARTMEFINKHAYIQIALKGDSFCVAAWEGFAIIVRNLGRFSTLTLIGGFFNIFGTLFISASSGLIGYLLITKLEYFYANVTSPVLPTFVMVLIGFIIGIICMNVFGTSADALMHSFLLDEELNKGQPKSYPELQKFMTNER